MSADTRWPFDGLLDSWALALESEKKSPKTLENYSAGVTQLARWLGEHDHSDHDVRAVTADQIRGWLADLARTRSDETCRTRYVAVRQFFLWLDAEGELDDGPNPMVNIVQPKVVERPVDPLTPDELRRLLKDCEGKDFASLRDTALVLLFLDCGGRLSGVVGLREPDLDMRERTARIILKGGKELEVPFGARTAQALDRYLRAKRRQRYGERDWLWLSSTNKGRLTNNGVQQMLRRRGAKLGIHLHPHKFRHTFADNWLEAGGSEGDLQELMGWESRQMLGRYTKRRRAVRAREAHRAYSPADRL